MKDTKMKKSCKCPYCNRRHKLEKTKEVVNVMIEGKSQVIITDAYICSSMKKTFYDLEQLNHVFKIIADKSKDIKKKNEERDSKRIKAKNS